MQAGMWLGFLLTSVVPLLIKGQVSPSITITRITPIDIINGGIVCPNLHPVEITCVGIEVTLLQWRRNGTNIGGGFSIASNNGAVQQVDSFTLILDSITTRDIVANMTSRLVTNISNLNSGDRIGCVAVMQDIRTLDYILRERPPEVPTNIPVSIDSNGAIVNVSIAWDSAFNLLHSVSSYRVVASGESAASCPSSCDPSGPCMCTGLGIGEDTIISITAINCGDQMGMPVEITARPQVLSRPSECSVLPVYSSAGNLNAVDLTWTNVKNPPEFLPGVSQDVTDYSIAVGTMDPTTIPASIACHTGTCFHSNYSIQSLSVFNSPLSASVSAVNVVGRGEVCTPQTEIDTRNQIFSLTLDTTNIGNQAVACILLSAEECEFCFSAGDSCQNLTCIPATETPTLLPSLTELTYCYRATASVSGNAVAVIQDTFNTACPPAALGSTTDGPTDTRCSSDSMGSVSIPHGLGCYDGQRRGALTNYQCDKWYALSGGSSRTCVGDGNWDGEVPECRLKSVNIALLVTSTLMWVLSIFLTMIAAFALKKELPCKFSCLFNLQILPLWLKITCVVLMTIECVFLLVALLLWIVFSGTPSSKLQPTSLLIAAFVLALPWIIVALVVLKLASKCCSDDPTAHEAGIQKIEKSDMNISSNEAYGVAHHVEEVEEIVYNYPQMNFDSATIEAQQNEAYATNIVTQGNEAYATIAS